MGLLPDVKNFVNKVNSEGAHLIGMRLQEPCL